MTKCVGKILGLYSDSLSASVSTSVLASNPLTVAERVGLYLC